MKRIIKITFAIVLLCLLAAPLSTIKASNTFDGLYQEISTKETVIYNTVVWKNIIANTKTTKAVGNEAGYGSTVPCVNNKWYGQQINVLEVPRLEGLDGNQKYRVVAWSCFQDEAWKFTGATALAQDYEQKHPNEIVLGGVNGDFYDWHTTNDYPNSGNGIEVHNGDAIRTVHLPGWGMVGIRNTLDENQLVFSPNATDAEIDPEMSLVIYDENDNVIREIKLAEVNKPELQIGETAAYFGYLERVYIYDDAGNHVIDGNGEYAIRERIYHEPTLAQGDTYLIENGELVIYQAADNSYFGKGVITASQNVLTVPRKSFAIVSRNDEISSLLANGVKVRVQYNLVGEFADVTDALGCADALVLDGDWCEYYDSESYYTTRAPRTLIGQKADGTICLLTMDGRQPEKNFYGTNQQEIDTVLEQLNITDAFLLDGGGSSTFFVRENNKFVIKNSPSDGHQRSVSNGFLIVTDKDESVKLSKIEPQQTAAKFYIDTEKVDERVSKVYLQIDDSNLVPFIDGEVTIARLDSNTEYNYVLYYRTLAGDVIPTTNIGAFKTLKVVPSVSLGEFTSDEDYLYPKIVVDDPDKALLMARITVNNKKYNFDLDDDTKQIKISIPNDATSIDCVINYAYQLGDKEEIVEGELRLNYELPSQGEPAPIKKGCGAKAVYIVGFGSLALIGVILLKRKQY